MLGVDKPYGPISWFLSVVTFAFLVCLITWAWVAQSDGSIQFVALAFPLLAAVVVAWWTMKWRHNEAVRKGKRPPSV
ncbi:MAG TPA: hypothetical protein VFR32_07715 [Gaiellaceae bacterium]|nr:hypothetical protein [Gaiellaceae bacterium]